MGFPGLGDSRGMAIPRKLPASAAGKTSFYQSQRKCAQITAPSGSCRGGALSRSPRCVLAVLDVPVPAPSPGRYRGILPEPIPAPCGFSCPTLDFSRI